MSKEYSFRTGEESDEACRAIMRLLGSGIVARSDHSGSVHILFSDDDFSLEFFVGVDEDYKGYLALEVIERGADDGLAE